MALCGPLKMKHLYFAVNLLLPVCAYVLDKNLDFRSNSLEVKEFQKCLQRNRCSQNASTVSEGLMCQCDSECMMYGDCCIDAVRSSSKKTQSTLCVNIDDNSNQGIQMVNSCPSNYAGAEEIRRLCLNDDFNDIAKSAPVTDFVNRQIYLNRYCATCNNVPLIFVKAWTVSACIVENSTLKNFSLTDLTYYPTEKKWGYELDGRFQQCKFIFEKPLSTPAIGRLCRLDYISSCPKIWTGDRKACESYISVVKDSNNILYKNLHCAICNGVILSDIKCPTRARRDFSPTLLYTLLDINKAFGANRIFHPIYKPPLPSCPDGQLYDRYFRKCRTPVCAWRGYSVRNGKCVKD
ncbi:uncharacterized protein LOC129974920 isoform X2 [Argiope bruennichi]|uniref:SMB domain-containing protein n=1 Tax=Argiope bruennichi TaxID=94029 RepID=A0A8T0EMC5_ARGBR|nr:uncharacterized protein LOC129974920 isoform X2 [Argiope bruennichi]XP_055943686.1 uncharacterized protein LOC129974920 isoform X2 [Argiope bruennichi]KAF8777002.1 hypothetical protein HNY73_013932 [Argiope bruennichi]